MDTNPNSPSIGAEELQSTPYPLQPGTITLWLGRGEALGRAARSIAMSIANWRRQAADKLPTDPPPAPG